MKANWRTLPSYKRWRTLVFKRDGYKCVNCRATDKLIPHHIKPADLYPNLRLIVSNGQTLCRSCHSRLGVRAPKFREDRRYGLNHLFRRFRRMLAGDPISIGIVMVAPNCYRTATLYSTPTGSVALLAPRDLSLSHIQKALGIISVELKRLEEEPK